MKLTLLFSSLSVLCLCNLVLAQRPIKDQAVETTIAAKEQVAMDRQAAENTNVKRAWLMQEERRKSAGYRLTPGSATDRSEKLTTGYNRLTGDGVISTPAVSLSFDQAEKIFSIEYRYGGNKLKKGGNNFVLAVTGAGEDDRVALLIDEIERRKQGMVDKLVRFDLGKGEKEGGDKVLYDTDRKTLLSLISGYRAFVKIGALKMPVEGELLDAIKHLLSETK